MWFLAAYSATAESDLCQTSLQQCLGDAVPDGSYLRTWSLWKSVLTLVIGGEQSLINSDLSGMVPNLVLWGESPVHYLWLYPKTSYWNLVIWGAIPIYFVTLKEEFPEFGGLEKKFLYLKWSQGKISLILVIRRGKVHNLSELRGNVP
jgi:hypothetical protein